MEGLVNHLPGKVNSLLIHFGVFFLLLTFICIILYALDDRILMGVNIWLKPLKFSISIGIFLITSAYLLPLLPHSTGKSNFIAWILIITMLIEIISIMIQASRGQQSHFNITDPLGRILFPLMGFAIAVTYLVYGYLLFEFFIQNTNLPTSLLWAIRLGLIVFLFGGISGSTMASSLHHNIGVADGGIGLPFTNWSTVGGDLRVSHFISLHAIQLLPLLALWLIRLDFNYSTLAIVITGCLYLLFSVFTYIQALQGEPFIKLST